jgi:hypothetical protein
MTTLRSGVIADRRRISRFAQKAAVELLALFPSKAFNIFLLWVVHVARKSPHSVEGKTWQRPGCILRSMVHSDHQFFSNRINDRLKLSLVALKISASRNRVSKSLLQSALLIYKLIYQVIEKGDIYSALF